MRDKKESWADLLTFSLKTLLIYFSLQTVVVITHEFAHSTAAWLLGKTATPFTVVWGNPITILGWDEGVPYDQLFPGGGNLAESIIGGIPLFVHAVFVALALYLLVRRLPAWRKMTFYAVYLFAVVNLTELVAYILMRPWAGSGDTGRFNEGLQISPWPLFVVGSTFLVFAFAVLVSKVLPKLDHALGMSNRRHWIVVCFTAFVMFLWGSGFRIMLLYPDRQWKWGLIGIVGFFAWILAASFRVSRAPHS
ncbi:hypothetical protein [Silvibacterium acidisoli]|uniref:hypothetical protein n=1 Tax=Acidobacteriaceae bacterium ZG23-2 TaxID=2883246 RepID=UPI00406D3517